MNFATPAVLLVLFFLPGVLFRNAYLKGTWRSHPFKLGTLVEEVGYGAAIALIFHILWILLANAMCSPADLSAVLSLAYGPSSDNSGFNEAKLNASTHAAQIATYFSTIYAFSGGMGLLAHCLVRWLHLDRTPKLRFPHNWYYLFSGEQMNLPAADTKVEDKQGVSITLVALLVEVGKDPYIYRGQLEDYYFDTAGQLDRLLVKWPQRAKLAEIESIELELITAPAESQEPPISQPSLQDAFRDIEGSYMVFFCREIKNMHVAYAHFEKTIPVAPPVEPPAEQATTEGNGAMAS